MLATLACFIPRWLYDALKGTLGVAIFGLSFSPLFVVPGLVFGLIIGRAPRRQGLVAGGRYPAYVMAAGLSYFVTVQITFEILMDLLDNIVMVGVAAGAIGAALFFTIGSKQFFGWLLLFASWQAGYAAAMATAFATGGAGRRTSHRDGIER